MPTTLDDESVPDEFIGRMCAWYKSHGHGFMVLENKSQYPRSSFYDTAYHLSEEHQIYHSRLVADRLREILGNSLSVESRQVVPDSCAAGVIR